MLLDGGLELLDILGSSFAEGGLRLTVPLLAFFRSGIYLRSTISVELKTARGDREDIQAYDHLCVSGPEQVLALGSDPRVLGRTPRRTPLRRVRALEPVGYRERLTLPGRGRARGG